MATKKKLLKAAAGNAGAPPDDYWLALLGGASDDGNAGRVALTSTGDVVMSGTTESDGAGGVDALIVKYNGLGELQWARTLGGSSGDRFNDVLIDSADNIIAVGLTDSVGQGADDFLIVKYNSSGVLQWSRTLGAGPSNDQGYDVAIDSSDNIIVVGNSDSFATREAVVAKYNSSGTLQWARALGGASSESFYGVVTDSSDDIILVGSTESDGAGSTDGLVAKYNSAGTYQWARTLGGASSDSFNSVTLDSSGNIISVGNSSSDGAGGSDALVAKYNSSGTLQWARTLGGVEFDGSGGVAIDSSDNIITSGFTVSDGAGNFDGSLTKYNSSGTLQWTRTLGGTSLDFMREPAVDASDNIYFSMQTSSDGAGGYDILVGKLPGDGSGTGTYGSLTYQEAVFTDEAAVLTDAAAVLTDSDATSTLTDASAASLVDAAAVLSEEFFEVTP